MGRTQAHDQDPAPAARRQRDAALRRTGDDDAPADAAVSAKGLDACFVGVPLDIGTSNRAGARFGPRQIRAESCLIRPYNMATRAAPFDSLSVADIGDVAINTFDLKKSHRHHRSGLRRDPRPRLQAADHGRRPHDRLSRSCGR